MYRETSGRSVAKALSYRLSGSLTTVLVAYLFTREAGLALTIGGLDVVFKLAVYFIHERIWNKIRFGRHEVKPIVVWITGLSGSGKTSIAAKVTERLRAMHFHVEHLDGDTVRQLFPSTGFSKHDVDEHIRRVGYLASKLEAHGVFVVASFISPYGESRDFVRGLCRNFVLVHLATPVEVCEKRDTQGLFAKARRGEISHFPGVDLIYEPPSNPSLVLDTSVVSVDDAVDRLMVELNARL